MTRRWIAVVGTFVASVLAPAGADAAWSEKQQVIGFLSEKPPVVAVEGTGTIDLGIATGPTGGGPSGLGTGAFHVTRAAAATGWTGVGVTITKISGAPNSSDWAVSPSGAALVTWSAGSPAQPFAAFKPAGGAWGAATQLDTSGAKMYNAPIPVINDDGDAAVVWWRKAAGESYALNMANQVVYSSPGVAGWPAAPTKLADVSVPTPQVPDGSGGFKFNGCFPDLTAAIQPDGTPIAAWSDAYGSWKEKNGSETTLERALCGVRVSDGGAAAAVTPRTAATWMQEAGPGLAGWAALSVSASKTDGSTAVVVRGLEDSVEVGGSCTGVNACSKSPTEARVALGTDASVSGPGSLVGTSSNAIVALRNGRTAMVTYSAANGVRAGVGIGFPALSPLSPSVPFSSAAIALNEAGAAHVAIPGIISPAGLYAFDAAPAGSFGAGSQLDTSSGVQKVPSVAIDCGGEAVIAWARTSPAGQLYTSRFGAAPTVCEGEPQPQPEPEPKPTPGGGGGSTTTTTPSGTTIVSSPPPSAATLAAMTVPKLDPNGSKVKFEIVCAPVAVNACGGKVVIRKSSGGQARVSAAGGTTLGSLNFSGLKPGKSRKLEVPLVGSAKKALRRGKKLKVTIAATVHDGSGLTRTTSKSATLKLPG